MAGLISVQASATTLSGVLESASQNHLFWYLSRTSAILAYILLFINIVFGLGLKTKFLDKLSARWQSFDLHQFSALLALALIAKRFISAPIWQLPPRVDSIGHCQFLYPDHYRSEQLHAAFHRTEGLANDSYDFLRLVLCHSISRFTQWHG
jgi:hypothetical protein